MTTIATMVRSDNHGLVHEWSIHVIRLVNQHFLKAWQDAHPEGRKNCGLLSLMRRHAWRMTPEQQDCFWEMCLAYRLLVSGYQLVQRAEIAPGGAGPDICVLHDGKRYWFEAIAPMQGEEGGIVPSYDGARVVRDAPQRQTQLRITGALYNKARKLTQYQNDGIIAPGEPASVAIGAAHFGIYAGGDDLPWAVSSVYPIGDAYLRVHPETLEVHEHGYQYSENVIRDDNPSVPRNAFLSDQFTNVAGIVWCRSSIGAMRRPLSYIHNSRAESPQDMCWSVWDSEFVAEENGSEFTVQDLQAR